MTIETVKKHYNKEIKTYNENFNQRELLIDISIAVKKMIYPDFMIVNKTKQKIQYHGLKMARWSNDFLMTHFKEN